MDKRGKVCVQKKITRAHSYIQLMDSIAFQWFFSNVFLVLYLEKFRFRVISVLSHFNCILCVCVEPTLCAINHRHTQNGVITKKKQKVH